eukprot:Tbor_TRINITY_DN2964_c0_g1::TRINITY_DN2964_c0_g1_i1::g.1080::m.1080/K01895/ACSS, acs; acetyl-CoA synthetase
MAEENHYREMREQDIYQPSSRNTKNSPHGGFAIEDRKAMYRKSIQHRAEYWAEIARTFTWKKEWNPEEVYKVNFSLSKGPVSIRWFDGGITNMCYNCVDRWLDKGFGDTIAIYGEGSNIHDTSSVTYKQLHQQVLELSSVLKHQYGVKKGDCVSIYLPMIVFAPVAMLAVARLGAVCCVVFGGFSAQSLALRIQNSKTKVLITADGTTRGNKHIALKEIVHDALEMCEMKGFSCKAIFYGHLKEERPSSTPLVEGRDVWYQDCLEKLQLDGKVDDYVEWVEAEHPLFVLYTSGSTGTPKGLVHTTGGYMVYVATTFKYVFDYKPGDVFFCTADIGWITGHSYVTFGPLLNRATMVIFDGVPTYPTPSRWWEIVDKHKVTQFYTAPTAIRSLMMCGDEPVKKTSRSTLRVLGSVGEPINKDAWVWYYDVVGDRHVDICDSWWQTETGGIMITPLPGNTLMKPGSATLPFFGIEPVVLNPNTHECISETVCEGLLCISDSWPGQARTILGDHARFEETYFSYDGYYFSGDGCRRDEDGYYWLTGRVDDVLNVSGHRLGTSEIECAINTHPAVVESAVVGVPHDIKGEGIYAFVSLCVGYEPSKQLFNEVRLLVRDAIGPIANLDYIQPAPGLPKTRSGKIMRRILRKIATNDVQDLGDISTLADPSVVEDLIVHKSEWVVKL